MHVGLRTGFPHDGSGTPDMIGVAVSENQVFKLVWRTGKTTNSLKDGYLLFRKTGVDQRQSVVASIR